jgi:hypothetical protein
VIHVTRKFVRFGKRTFGSLWETAGTYAKVAFAKLYTTKTPITSADLLNDRVLPFYEEHGLPLLRILTDRGTEYCGKADRHDYQLYLA